jgi:hypothetical protein
MRDKRAIIIKDPKLRKIRNGLRDILLEAVLVKSKSIRDQMQNLKKSSDGVSRSIRDLSPDELGQYRDYQEQQSELRMLSQRSICMCISCGKGDRDMIYNKSYDAWYCTECYGMERDYAKELQKKRVKMGGKPKGHEEEAIESHSKTFL